MGNSRQVVVASNLESTEAHLMRGRLEAEGIRCWVDDEITATIYFGFAMGGVKLKVHVEDEGLARELMYGKAAGGAPCPTCPACGSTDVIGNSMGFFWLLLLTVVSFGLYLPLRYKKNQCGECGCRW